MNELRVTKTPGGLMVDSRDVAVIEQRIKEQKIELGELVSLVKKKREECLEKLFSNIPDECMNSICATAEQFDKPMLGGVYFIKNEYNDMIKIGYANNIKERFDQLKGSFSHLGMEPRLRLIGIVLTFKKYMGPMESYFHKAFSDHRVIGEWFKVSVEDVQSEIFPITDQFGIVNDVFIDYTDYEYMYFKKIPRSYVVSDKEIKAISKINAFTNNFSPFDILGRKDNEPSTVLGVVEENKVGFHDLHYCCSDTDVTCERIGIKHLETDQTFNFQELKRHKFNNADWDSITKSINAG